MNIRARAQAAWQERQNEYAKAREEEAAEKLQRDALELKAALKRILDIECNPTSENIELDGVTFFYSRRGSSLYAMIPCDYPHCEGFKISFPINDWTDLGAALQGNWNHHQHYAHTPDGEYYDLPVRIPGLSMEDTVPRTSADLLLDALRTFIREYTQEHEV